MSKDPRTGVLIVHPSQPAKYKPLPLRSERLIVAARHHPRRRLRRHVPGVKSLRCLTMRAIIPAGGCAGTFPKPILHGQ